MAYYLRPDHIPRTLWRHRQLIGQLTKRNLLLRYRGSALGLLWSLLLPLLMLVVYTFAFGFVLQARWGLGDESKVRFALKLFCGLLLFNIFAETASACAALIVAHANYVKKVVFPLEILPAALLTRWCKAYQLAGAADGHSAVEQRLPPAAYYPLTFVPLLLLCLGWSWFWHLSACNARRGAGDHRYYSNPHLHDADLSTLGYARIAAHPNVQFVMA